MRRKIAFISWLTPQEPLNLPTGANIKKQMTQISKHNKQVDKAKLVMQPIPPTPQELNRAAAEADNARPGPGLRRGPARRRSSAASRRSRVSDDERPEGRGWGGFPLVMGDRDQTGDDMTTAGQEHQNRNLEQGSEVLESESDQVESQESGKERDNVSELIALAKDMGIPDVPDIPEIAEPPEPHPNPIDYSKSSSSSPEAYVFHAQQAAILAAAGGLAQALFDKNSPEAVDDVPPEIGRSLFLALDLTTWEDDPSVVLEAGWSATWWQREESAGGGGMEMMHDEGHFV